MEVYKENRKLWKLYTLGFLVFWTPALVIDLIPDYNHIINLPLKVVGLVFLMLALPKVRCPKCKKIPGFVFHVKTCRACSERLS